jgi:uncharacterized RDD family membrane protein YckC
LKQIEIKTSDRISIQFNIADLKDRAIAFLVDSGILYSTLLSLLMIRMLVFPNEDPDDFVMYILFPIFLFYTLVSEIITGGQSLGKKAMSLRTVKLNGQYATTLDYVIRWLFRWLDIWMSLFVIGSVLINSTQYGQRLGDLLAGTTVIKFSKSNAVQLADILKMDNQENYHPTYPQVTQLSDKDMILVKKALFQKSMFQNKAHDVIVHELAIHLQKELKVKNQQKNEVDFLRTLLKDYVVLTRS